MAKTKISAEVIRDRIIELRRVKASELMPNAANWRRHPKAQQVAMTEMLTDIGYADALLARQDDSGKLILIDGHMRAGLNPEATVPILVLDVTEEEAKKLLLTLDPLSAMAQPDQDALIELLEGTADGLPGPGVSAMLEALANGERQILQDFSNLSGPDQERINRREEELAGSIRKRAAEELTEYVDLVCPHCGGKYTVKRSEFLKNSSV